MALLFCNMSAGMADDAALCECSGSSEMAVLWICNGSALLADEVALGFCNGSALCADDVALCWNGAADVADDDVALLVCNGRAADVADACRPPPVCVPCAGMATKGGFNSGWTPGSSSQLNCTRLSSRTAMMLGSAVLLGQTVMYSLSSLLTTVAHEPFNDLRFVRFLTLTLVPAGNKSCIESADVADMALWYCNGSALLADVAL